MEDHPKDGSTVVTVEVADLDAARELMDALEEHGVPSYAITLDGVEDAGGGAPGDATMSPMVGAAGRSVAVGVAMGAVVGSLAGLVGSTAWGLPLLSALLGGLVGGILGGIAGGMSVAKYNTRDRAATYDADSESSMLRVAVRHGDDSVVSAARDTMTDLGHRVL